MAQPPGAAFSRQPRDWRLHTLKDRDLFWLFDVDLERLLRSMQADPTEIGEDRWTQAVLGTCGHLTQSYQEFKRRCGTRRARSLVREELLYFVVLGTEETEAPTQAPALAQTCGTEVLVC